MGIHPVQASAIGPYLDEKETRRDRALAVVCEQLPLLIGQEIRESGAVDTSFQSEGGNGRYEPARDDNTETTSEQDAAISRRDLPAPRRGLHERESDGTMPFQFFSLELEKTCAISRKRFTKRIGVQTYADSKGNTGTLPTEGVIIDKREEIGMAKKKAA